MKGKMLFALALAMGTSTMAQDIVQLPAPDKNVPTTLFQALQDRHSVRSFASTPIDTPLLSQLLWAATGVNRADGRMTAPTATNAQDILLYVATKDGVCLYQPKDNTLKVVATQDIRPALAGSQTAVASAPVFLLIVSDLSKFNARMGDTARQFAAEDAGYVSQNIGLAATALGLGTVPRHIMDRDAVKAALGLGDRHMLLLNHPVGYPLP